jgi:hypothetical protein
MKPRHESRYGPEHTTLCERTLVTLLRGLGPWRRGIYLTGGLVPRYLVPRSGREEIPTHVGTTDVDLVLDIEVLAGVEAYRKLVKNIEDLGSSAPGKTVPRPMLAFRRTPAAPT